MSFGTPTKLGFSDRIPREFGVPAGVLTPPVELGPARQFNGTTDYLMASAAAATDEPFTLATWFKVISMVNNGYALSLCVPGASQRSGLIVATSNKHLQGIAQNGGSYTLLDIAVDVNDGEWHHGVFVCASDSDRRLYLDGGNKVTSTTSVSIPSATRTLIGAVYQGASIVFRFPGIVCESAIWNIALSDSEVAQIATRGTKPSDVQAGSLVGYWPVKGDSPEVNEGTVGSSVDMTVNGTTIVNDRPF